MRYRTTLLVFGAMVGMAWLAGIAHAELVTTSYTTNAIFTVPAGVSSVTIKVWGAGGGGGGGGGNGTGGGGGAGGYAQGTFSVSVNDALDIRVGEGGGGGLSLATGPTGEGGGGGGLSSVSNTTTTTLLVLAAGGGAGGGGDNGSVNGAAGGAGGSASGSDGSNGGGGTDGGNGATDIAVGAGGSTHSTGSAGTAFTGGAGGRSGGSSALNGGAGGGGDGGSVTWNPAGGGGGAGIFGGGGGSGADGASLAGGGGGGGASYLDPAGSGIVNTRGTGGAGGTAGAKSGDGGDGGDGHVVLVYVVPEPPITVSGYAMEITFTNFSGRGTLTNFPALVKLTDANTDDYTGFLDTDSGWDLRFSTSKSGGPELKYEIESFDTNGTSYIWVRVPDLTHNTSIWALWGDSDYNTQETYTTNGDVWSEGYKVVYHLNTDSADSTATGLDAVQENGVVTGVDGISANAIDLASGARLDLGGAGWGFMCGSGSNFTLSAWVNLDANASDAILFGRFYNVDGGSSRWKFWADAGGARNYVFASLRSGTVLTSTSGGCLSSVGSWQYVVATKSGNTLSVYVDAGTPNTATLYLNDSVNNRLSVGTDHGDGTASAMNGQVDEVRISTVARSSNWLWAEYKNQGLDHDQFVEYGSVEPPSGGTMFMFR